MKQTKLRNLKDNAKFYLSKRKGAALYSLDRIDKKQKTATYTLVGKVKRTFERKWDLACFLSKTK